VEVPREGWAALVPAGPLLHGIPGIRLAGAAALIIASGVWLTRRPECCYAPLGRPMSGTEAGRRGNLASYPG